MSEKSLAGGTSRSSADSPDCELGSSLGMKSIGVLQQRHEAVVDQILRIASRTRQPPCRSIYRSTVDQVTYGNGNCRGSPAGLSDSRGVPRGRRSAVSSFFGAWRSGLDRGARICRRRPGRPAREREVAARGAGRFAGRLRALCAGFPADRKEL